jgi:F-type H+-transporting ATPase subunit b
MPQFDFHFFTPLVFWTVVSFGILLFLLYRYAFPEILKVLEEREARIRGDLDQAERLKKEAEQLHASYEAKIKSAAQEAQQIVEEARVRARRVQEENEQRIQQETERQLAEARAAIQREREHAVQEIQRYTVDLTLLAAEKVLARTLTKADHQKLIEDALQTVVREHPPQ